MITYQLNQLGSFAQKFVGGIATGEWVNTKTNESYLAWVAKGGVPTPADEVTL